MPIKALERIDEILSNYQGEFDLKRIQETMNISERAIKNCPIPEEELKKIYYDYMMRLQSLEKNRIEIIGALSEGLTGEVHSIRSRVKHPDHLIAKIIRGLYRNPVKYQLINAENYWKLITDLIGVRIIILDKRDWKGVHKDILRLYKNDSDRYVRRPKDTLINYDKYRKEVMEAKAGPACGYHAERPVVFIASEGDRKLYRDEFIRIDTSKEHYRSLHYIIRYKEVYFELQMRSLFEEGWLEFDHRMKYPNDQYNKKKQEYISILSNLAIAADQLISYYEEEDFVEKREQKEVRENQRNYRTGVMKDFCLEDKMKILF